MILRSKDNSLHCEIGECIGEGDEGKVYILTKVNKKLTYDMVLKVFSDIEHAEDKYQHINTLIPSDIKKKLWQTPVLECIIPEAFISDNDKCCLIMAKAKGKTIEDKATLKEVINLPLINKLELATQVAEGVETIHDLGIIHSELSVQNLVINLSRNEARIIDIDGGGLLDSLPAWVKGYPETMAPEILDGSYESSSLSTDRWSLAVLLHILLVGIHPFHFCENHNDWYNYAQSWPPDPRLFKGESHERLINQHGVLTQITDIADRFKQAFRNGFARGIERPSAGDWRQCLERHVTKTEPAVTCPQCGLQHKWDLIYCIRCFSVLHGIPYRCPGCRNFVPYNAKYCPECKKKHLD